MWIPPLAKGMHGVRIMHEGEEVVGDIMEEVQEIMRVKEAHQYMAQHGGKGVKLSGRVSEVLMRMRGGREGGGLRARARRVRHMWGWAPDCHKMCQRGQGESNACPLCGASDSRGHAVRECKQPQLVAVRRKLVGSMLGKLMKVQGVSGVWLRAMQLVWGLQEDGSMRQWEGMGWEACEELVRRKCRAMVGGQGEEVMGVMGRWEGGGLGG
jgi:hypothetical protein